jgi:hypothetical protein
MRHVATTDAWSFSDVTWESEEIANPAVLGMRDETPLRFMRDAASNRFAGF